MVFVPPTWIEGLLISIGIGIILLIIPFIIFSLGAITENDILGIIGLILAFIVIFAGVPYVLHNIFETPSVEEKIITVEGYQPHPKLSVSDYVVDSADDLLIVTSAGETYENTENFWFGKFDTRDVLNQLKENGTYKITYYGWREGFNDGFPNILTVDEVINETNTSNMDYNKYFGYQIMLN